MAPAAISFTLGYYYMNDYGGNTWDSVLSFSHSASNTGDTGFSGIAQFTDGWSAGDYVFQQGVARGGHRYPPLLSDTYSYTPSGYFIWVVTVTAPPTFNVTSGSTAILKVAWDCSASLSSTTLVSCPSPDTGNAYTACNFSSSYLSASLPGEGCSGILDTNNGSSSAGPTTYQLSVPDMVPVNLGFGGTYTTWSYTMPRVLWGLSGYSNVQTMFDYAGTSVGGTLTCSVDPNMSLSSLIVS